MTKCLIFVIAIGVLIMLSKAAWSLAHRSLGKKVLGSAGAAATNCNQRRYAETWMPDKQFLERFMGPTLYPPATPGTKWVWNPVNGNFVS